MKANRCPSCGASLKGNELNCPYCGTSYKADTPQIKIEITKPTITLEKKYSTRTISEVANELSKLKSNTQRTTLITVIPLVFMAIIILSMVSIFSQAVKTMMIIGDGFSIITIIPVFFMAFAILSVFLSVISKPSQKYLKKTIKLLQEDKLDEAYSFVKSKMHTSNTIVGTAVVIAFYLKKDYMFATNGIRRVKADTFILFERHTNLLTNAAFEMDYIPPSTSI